MRHKTMTITIKQQQQQNNKNHRVNQPNNPPNKLTILTSTKKSTTGATTIPNTVQSRLFHFLFSNNRIHVQLYYVVAVI